MALIDTGVNVYHEAFQSDVGIEPYRAVLPSDVKDFPLTKNGTFADRVSADKPLWDQVEPRQLYAFPGTRLLGMTFLPKTPESGGIFSPPARATLLDALGHGTGTASVVAQTDPEALIVFLQVDTEACFNIPKASCLLSPTIAEAMTWAASQPWIDVISVSISPRGHPWDPGAVHPEAKAYLDASRLAVRSGKLVVNSAGNNPGPTLMDYFTGPPHVITVGGAESAERGTTMTASSGVDVIANYTASVARADDTKEFESAFGTSFGTPLVAGVLSRSLGEIRGAPDPSKANVTSGDLRRALNLSARLWMPTDYQLNISLALNAAPVLLPGQMGWGYVDGSTPDAIVARILAGDYALPSEKTATAQAQAAYDAVRHAFWDGQ